MLRYNKAVEYLQSRFADAMQSMDPRFDLDAIETVMARDQVMPYIDKFLLGSQRAPVLFLLVSEQLWTPSDAAGVGEDGRPLESAPDRPVTPSAFEPLSHLDRVMFAPKVTNATGVAAIVYAMRVPNPRTSNLSTGQEASAGTESALIDVTTEVLFGVLQNNPVEEFVSLARDVLIPIGMQCHQQTLDDYRGSDATGNVREGASDAVQHNKTLRSLQGYSSERSREKTSQAVDAFYRNARAAVENVDRLDRDKDQLVGFILEDPHHVLRRVQVTPMGIERAAKDPTVTTFVTSLFVRWLNYSREHGTRDAVSGFYPVGAVGQGRKVPATAEGAGLSPAVLSHVTSHMATPAQQSLSIPKMADAVHATSLAPDAAEYPLSLGEGLTLAPLNPPRVYDFQRLPESYGPLTEVSHWKAFALHAQHLCDSTESRDVASLEAILNKCNPALADVWAANVRMLQAQRQEAKEVVQVLSAVARHFEPLYSIDPGECTHSIRDVVDTLSMIQQVLPHYRQTDHIQQLVQSVSHQLIHTCKQAIRSLGRVWEQSDNTQQLRLLLKKFTDATALCRTFQDRLSETSLYTDLDELCIFGKLELFCSRLQKLINLFSTMLVFRTLDDHHLGDGIAPILHTFFGIFEDLRRKSGDSLDYTKPSFDKDYLDFINKVADVDCSLQVYVNSCFEDVPNTVAALELLKKFSLLVTRPSLRADLQAKYFLLFQRFGAELEAVQRIYEQGKADPIIMRNAPPVAGRMMWARQLHHRIDLPMKCFQESQAMVSHQRDTGKIIRLFNRVAMALTEYEQYWLLTWRRAVEVANDGLKATLLVRGPSRKGHATTKSPSFIVNFDATISLMAREARWMIALGCEVPPLAADLLRTRASQHAVAMTQCVAWFDAAVAAIKPVHEVPLTARVEDVRRLLVAAATSITWNSASIPPFIQKLTTAIQCLDDLVKRVNGMEEHLIRAPVDKVEDTCLVPTAAMWATVLASAEGGGTSANDAALAPPDAYTPTGNAPPVGTTLSLDAFVGHIAEATTKARNDLSTNNKVVRDAVMDLCGLIDGAWRPCGASASDNPTHVMLTNMYVSYNRTLFKSVLRATLRSFNDLRAMITHKEPTFPTIALDVVLSPPNLFASPSLEEVQAAMHLAMRMMLESTQATGNWPNVRGAYSTGDSAPFYEEVHRNKEVVKHILLVSADILHARRQVEDFLKSFEVFRNVWMQNPVDVVKTFSDAPGRTVEHFAEELQFCSKLSNQVHLIPDNVAIQCFSLDCASMKRTLSQIAQKWCDRYGAALQALLERQLGVLLDSTEVSLKRVSHESVMDIEHIDGELQGLDQASAAMVDMERDIRAVEGGAELLQQYRVGQPSEIDERATDISLKWKKIMSLASEKRLAISSIQLSLRHELNEAIKGFGVEMLCFRNDVEENGPLVEGIQPEAAIEKLRRFQRALDDRLRTWKMHYQAELRFGVAVPHTYPELAKTVKELHVADQLYTLYTTVNQRVDAYGKILWRSVKYDDIVNELSELQRQIKRLPATVKAYHAYDAMKQKVEKLLDMQPIIEQLAHKSVRERHWQQVMKICGSSWSIDKDIFKLEMLWNANLMPYKDDIVELAMSSEKEGEVEIKLHQVISEWKDKELRFAEYKHRGFILLKGDDTTALKESLEEAIVLLGSLLASKYVAPFRHETAGWAARLSAVGETIALWLEVQSTWMYLEAVFSSGDIVKQLPHDAKRFSMIDRQWVKLFFRAVESPNVLEFSVSNEIKNLPYFKDQLELCQRALAQYLESKRNAFARFYFVSDAVLLEVLAQGSDPTAMQPHFSAIFDGIHSVQLETSADKKVWKVKAMVSAEDEVVPLSELVACEGSIEEWLTKLASEMARSVRIVLREAVGDALSIRTDASLLRRFYAAHFSQAVLTALQVLYTTSVTEALSGAPSERRDMSKRLTEVKDVLAEQARGSLSAAMRTHIQTLTTMAVHNLEVWDDHAKKAKDAMSFEWQRQLRFYWTDRNECVLRIADADVMYCNEYLGVKERLVITPLTDRCYITLSQALAMYMGGAPAGPAGTGKTETVKDLGRAAGIYVVVFNCSDQYDARATAKVFRGLAQSGCWGCLDEFNRITLPVLSVVSQQIHLTFSALKQHSNEFVFADGLSCKLLSTMGVFITMNPGYAGRQELPENLKVHFRSVSMMVPDRLCIMKTKLAAAGYKQDKPLSQKFNLLYALCEQQLSQQQHYDFGLRNILSVLRTAGDVLRRSQSTDEEAVFMRCVRDMNVAKFVHDDVPVFLCLLHDIFAGKVPERMSFVNLEGALRDAAEEATITVTDTWMKKCLELYETKRVRHGVMIVGPAGGGKSCCMRALLRALHHVEGRHKEVRLSPKALTVAQLFGSLTTSGDWNDGVFSYLWRRWNKERNSSVWLVCDGPVDTLWIESLNTVLDDNRVLTLANGDRVLMNPLLRMCFEVESLQNASPATVSRAGIIYVSREDIGWRAVLESLVDRQIRAKRWPTAIKERIVALTAQYTHPAYKHIVKTYASFPGLSFAQMLSTFVSLVVPLVAAACQRYSEADQDKELWTVIKMVLCYGTLWAVGGSLDAPDRLALSRVMESGSLGGGFEAPPRLARAIQAVSSATPRASDGSAAPTSLSAASGGAAAPMPTLDAFFVDIEAGEWSPWKQQIPEWHARWDVNAPSINASSVFVPHLSSTILHSIMHIHFEQSYPVLLMGRTGSSKTVIMQEFLRSVSTDDLTWSKKNISRATTPLLLQRAIEDMCEKRMGSQYGPQRNRRLNLLVDDMSMADSNEWGDQPTCELLRQLMETGGVYSVDRVGDFKRFVDIKYFGAMTTSGGPKQQSDVGTSEGTEGSKYIPARLLRHFAVYRCSMPSEVSLRSIFESILGARFANTHLHGVCAAMVHATVEMFQRCHGRLLPSPTRLHYSYNLRDLNRVFQGVLMCPIKSLDNTHDLVSLWQHEVTRVFGDKLCHAEDAQWLQAQLAASMREAFGPGFHKDDVSLIYTNFVGDKIRDVVTGELAEPPKAYKQSTLPRVAAKVRERIDEFNEQRNVRTPAMDLVLFDAAVYHVCRLCRVIAVPRGNALCIGFGGSGKQTTARLAAHLQQQPLFQPSVNTEYHLLNWLEDLRGQYFLAATQGHCVMLITDNELKSEEFLEYINTSLSSGDVPGLFNADDKESARSLIRPIARKLNRREFEDSEEWLWHYFINRVQEQLHFVLCLSPQGERFQQRVRRFPAVIATCTIDYYFPWSRPAMLQVATAELAKDGLMEALTATPEVAGKLPHALVDAEASARALAHEYFTTHRLSIGITPAGFLNFLKTFVKVYLQKDKSIRLEAKNLRIGLQKLNQAGQDVVAMRKELNIKEVALAASTAELESLLEVMNEKALAATTKKKHVQDATDRIAEEAAAVAASRQDAENDLVAAQPALESAKAALEQITPTDIITLRAMRRPPEMIRRIFDGVCILLHERMADVTMAVSNSGRARIEDSWAHSGRAVCSRPNLLDTLLQFNVTGKDCLNDETCELLLPYLWQEDFTYERAKVASGNIAGLCTWVRAMEVYRRVAKFVAPKIDALRTAEAMLRTANTRLQSQTEELEVAEAAMAVCIAEVEAVRGEKDILEADTNRTKQRLAYASQLIEALADEKRRWQDQERAFNATMERLLGDSITAAAMVAFGGPLNAELRLKLQSMMSNVMVAQRIPFSGKQFNFVRFVVNEEAIAQWADEGLPMDTQSIENAVIASTTLLAPCFVDPQSQARQWLRQHLADRQPVFTTFNSPGFLRVLERQMERGHALVIEDVVFGCDPLLQALLAMRPSKPLSTLLFGSPMGSPKKGGEGGAFVSLIQDAAEQPKGPDMVAFILGAAYPCDKRFKVFVLPSKTRVDFEPEMYARVCVIDASVTLVGLEQQLLARLISAEKRELEVERVAVLTQIRTNEEVLRQLEEELLLKLSQSSGSLVDDETLILTLRNSKSSAQFVKEQLAIASETRQRIQEARDEYRPVSLRGAMLYFVATEMSQIEPAYELSLERMVTLFERAVETSLPSNVVAQRIQNIMHTVTQQFFGLVGRGLFEKHKLLFSLSIAIHAQRQAQQVSQDEFRLFLVGGTALDADAAQARGKALPWIGPSTWKHLVALVEQSKVFGNIMDIVGSNEQQFKAWFDTEAPETEVVPYYSRLTSFDRLLLVRCFREDRTMHAAVQYVKEIMGPNFVEVPAFNLEAMVKDEASVPRTPILFLLTAGSDPTAHIEHLSKKMKATVTQLSLGQGQEAAAVETLHRCAAAGEWVVFQNCHLGMSFLDYLERWAAALTRARDAPLDTPPDPSLPSPLRASRAMRESTGYSLSSAVAAKRGAQPAVDVMMEPDHADFRIFLTAEPVPDFPSRLLLRSLPLTNEPPSGTRATIKKILHWVQQDNWDLFPHPQWRACLQALCFYHCVVLERRKHGIYGWTTPYQFTEGDFNASLFFLQNMFGGMSEDVQSGGVSWEAVQFMIGDIHYGGRVTIRNDRATLHAVTESIFNANLSQASKSYLSPSLKRFPILADINDVPTWHHTMLEQFQVNEPPAFAGLGANAEVAHRTKLAQAALGTLLSMQPRRVEGPAPSKAQDGDAQQRVASQEDLALAQAQSCLKRLPAPWSDVQLQELVEQHDRLKPLTIFFNLEAQRLRAIIRRTSDVMRQVVSAITGASALTSESAETVAHLAMGLVPEALRTGTWPASSLPSWFSMLLRRYEQISEYLAKGERLVYDVRCLFNPQGFLNSVRQQICRNRGASSGWTLGRVETKLSVTKLSVADVERSAEEGAFLTGFYLDGAGWDVAKSRLRPPLPKELFRELPVVLVTAQLMASAPAATKTPAQSGGRAGSSKDTTTEQELAAYGAITQAAFRAHRAQRGMDNVVRKARIACFTNAARTDESLICHVELAHDDPDPSAWILRGVAMLTSIE